MDEQEEQTTYYIKISTFSKHKQTIVAMAWIDYKMVTETGGPANLDIRNLKKYEISEKVINFIKKAIKVEKEQFIARRQTRAEVKI